MRRDLDIRRMFLRSALTADSAVLPNDRFLPWFEGRRQAHRFVIEEIPFARLEKWHFAADTGNLVHESGRFFSIEGVHVRTSFGSFKEWSQPIMNQPEVGILGIVARDIDGVLHFLMQAKMEPGNIDMIQLAPTLQATRSNFTRVHRGRTPNYLELFTEPGRGRPLVDVLQSEQGARFLRKRNRNMIVQVTDDVPPHEDFCWLTLGQIQRLLRRDNVVNMDARTVLSCIPFAPSDDDAGGASEATLTVDGRTGVGAGPDDRFRRELLRSALATDGALHTSDEIIGWFTDRKLRYELDVERIPLREVRSWVRDDCSIHHESGLYFSVIACRVEADNREIGAWSQPLVKPREPGILALLVKQIGGVLHVLVQAKVEAGNSDVAEMAPTVQCLTGSYRRVPVDRWPPFLQYVLEARPEQFRHDTLQSEEGGRFFREANRNLVIEVDDDFPLRVPADYIWLTLRQMKEFIRYNNFMNVQCRCLLAGLSFV